MFGAPLAALTGIRRADIVRLSRSRVSERWISFVESKGGKRVEIPICRELQELLPAFQSDAPPFSQTLSDVRVPRTVGAPPGIEPSRERVSTYPFTIFAAPQQRGFTVPDWPNAISPR